jgi:hypothetical protein
MWEIIVSVRALKFSIFINIQAILSQYSLIDWRSGSTKILKYFNLGIPCFEKSEFKIIFNLVYGICFPRLVLL